MLDANFDIETDDWLIDQFDRLTDHLDILLPSEYIESVRVLPSSVTSMPGPYRFSVAPYLVEILDNFSPYSPVRFIDVMKGVQILFTVGILENALCYAIGHIKTDPCMMVTVDDDIAKIRLNKYIIPMLAHSDMDHLIMSSDEKNTRKTGRTEKQLDWEGGGFLLQFGANSPGKLRSTSIKFMFIDEPDGFKLTLGKDGAPVALAEARTKAYEDDRKVLAGSTPLIKQTSVIYKRYLQGDQRKYMVPCKHCGEMQFLVFQKVNEDGTIYGIVWDLDDNDRLIPDSVKYLCRHCQGEWTNDDKSWMYRDVGKYCHWEATAIPDSPDRRSYHLPSMYSPAGQQTWESIVREWLTCWDIVNNKSKDNALLQVFYNNVLGVPFEARGSGLKLAQVITHRRMGYTAGQVPNKMATEETGGPILFVTCTIDVHKEHIDIQTVGWCALGRFYSLEWIVLEGDTENIDDPNSPWATVRDFIYDKIYIADDGKKYKICTTLIDSRYRTDVVYRFCAEFSSSVFPIMGRNLPIKAARIKEYDTYQTRLGTDAYNITVTIYKDRLSAALKREWFGTEALQPQWHPNFPCDYSDKFFKELTHEYKAMKTNKETGEQLGMVWHNPGSGANHSWDLTVYAMAAVDIIVMDICENHLNLEYADYHMFWQYIADEKLFFSD